MNIDVDQVASAVYQLFGFRPAAEEVNKFTTEQLVMVANKIIDDTTTSTNDNPMGEALAEATRKLEQSPLGKVLAEHGPDFSDGHDWEGFPGGCKRMGCVDGCKSKDTQQNKCTPEDCKLSQETRAFVAHGLGLSDAQSTYSGQQAEAVGEVVWFDPTTRLLPEQAGKIIDGSIAFMESAPLGIQVFTHPPEATVLAQQVKDTAVEKMQKNLASYGSRHDEFDRGYIAGMNVAVSIMQSIPIPNELVAMEELCMRVTKVAGEAHFTEYKNSEMYEQLRAIVHDCLKQPY